jgi:hypothetical protein
MVANAVRDLREAFTLRQGENRKGLTRALMKPTPQVIIYSAKKQTGCLQSCQPAFMLFENIAIVQHIEHFKTPQPLWVAGISFVGFEQVFNIHHRINLHNLPSRL